MTRTHGLAALFLLACALLLAAGPARARQTPEQKCQKGRYDAAAKYAACQQRALVRLFGGARLDDRLQAAFSKCRVKYTDTWAKLQRKASGTDSTCDHVRYEDNGDGTVTDRLTGLQWEQKTGDGTLHDKGNSYSWGAGGPLVDATAADGSAFNGFLFWLNFPFGCFAGQCDWRLPTLAELQTILLEPYPCTTKPCIDQAAFGPMLGSYHWSATTVTTFPDYAWYVSFSDGSVLLAPKHSSISVRAVRAGS